MNRIAQYLVDTPPPPVLHRWQTVVPAEPPATFAPIPSQSLAGLDHASRYQLITLYHRARAAAEAEMRRVVIEDLLASL